MSNDKKNPTRIDADYVAKPTDELEKSIAADLDAEDPDDAEEIIASLEITEGDDDDEDVDTTESEEDLPESPSYAKNTEETETPTRHRGPKPDASA